MLIHGTYAASGGECDPERFKASQTQSFQSDNVPRRTILTERQRQSLFRLPDDTPTLLRHYVLSEEDLDRIRRGRRPRNRLGLALQLCALRYPGRLLQPSEAIPEPMLAFVAAQLGLAGDDRLGYGAREATRYQHSAMLQQLYGYRSFEGRAREEMKPWINRAAELAQMNDQFAADLLAEWASLLCGSPALCVDHAARRTRWRSRSKLARPYICRLISLSRVICPSAWPLLQGVVSAARITAPSCSSPAAKVSRARTPDVRASASQAFNATRAASGPTFGLTPHPRTRAVTRRASPATCAAVGSCSTRATRAASGPASADGGWTSSQASCEGDGNAGALSCGAGIGVWADALVRHRCGVLGAGAVRCSATQRCTCFAVPGKPAARSSRQRASAFSQPSASRACKWARYGSRMLRRSGRPSGTGKLSAAAYLRTVPTARFIARLIASSASPAACRRLTSS